MKIQTTPRDDHQVNLVVEIENDQFERKMHRAARHFSEHAKIPGFRPGKAPYDVVLRYAGEAQVREEAIEILVEEIYPEMLKQENIEPGAMGSLENVMSMDPLTLSFVVPLMPVVEIGDYHSVRVPYELPVVDDKQVKKTLDQYQNYFATLEPVEEPSAVGNVVSLILQGKAEGEIVIPERPVQIKITPASADEEDEWPYKGFNRKLVGLQTGDEKTISHKFPEDFPDENVKGKKVEFSFKVQSVKNVIPPVMNEEFFKNFGDYTTEEEFTADIRKRLESDLLADYDANFFSEVINKIRSDSVIKYPPQVLNSEVEELLESFTHELSHQRMDLDAYLKLRKMTKEEFIAQEITPQAIDRLERSLVMREISKLENIVLTDEEMQQGYNEALNDLASTQDLDQLIKKNSKDQLMNAIAMEGASRMLNRRIYAVLKSIATGSYVPAADTTDAEVIPEVLPVAEKPKARKPRAKKVSEEKAES